jgi:hypothetical protein
LCAPIIPVAPLGDFGTESPVAPLGDFCTESLLENTSILRTYCASPAAPLGDFCTESLLEKTSILRTYCASSAAPLGDFCTESILEKTSILRTYCAIPAAPLGDFLRGVSHARVVSAAPRGDFGMVECRRPSMRSFSTYCLSFLRGIFACILHGSASVAELPELFQLKCLSPALEARPHLNGNNPSIPRI